MEKQFNPEGDYRVFFKNLLTKEVRMAEGTMVNYYHGNMVLHNQIENTVIMIQYTDVVQLYPIKKMSIKDKEILVKNKNKEINRE